MFDQLGFKKMWNLLKEKGLYPQFQTYEQFQEFQKGERLKLEADAAAYDRDHGNAPLPEKLPF